TAVEQRVLIVGATGDEGDLMCQALADADIVCTPLAADQDLPRELHRGAGTLIIAEEDLRSRHERDVSAFVRNQPGWSDLPIFVLTSASTASPKAAQLLDLL